MTCTRTVAVATALVAGLLVAPSAGPAPARADDDAARATAYTLTAKPVRRVVPGEELGEIRAPSPTTTRRRARSPA